MKFIYLLLTLFFISCNDRTRLKLQADEEIFVEKHKDTLIIKDAKYISTFIIGNDSMYYDTNGILALSTNYFKQGKAFERIYKEGL